MKGMMERMHSQGGAYGGVLFLCLGQQIEQQKIKKIKFDVALDGCHLILYT
jgi:hypothetical protein